MNKKTRRIPFLVLAASLCATTSHASDSKIFNGTFCRRVTDPTALAEIRYSDTAVLNRSNTDDLRVACPILRDNTQNDTGWDHIIIGTIDRTMSGDRIQCVAYSRNSEGGVVFSDQVTSEPTPPQLWGELIIPNPADPPGSAIDGYYHLLCRIPHSNPDEPTGEPSGIAFYRVQEPT